MKVEYKIGETLYILFETEKELQEYIINVNALELLYPLTSIEFYEKELNFKVTREQVNALFVEKNEELFKSLWSSINQQEHVVRTIDLYIQKQQLPINQSLLDVFKRLDAGTYKNISSFQFPLKLHGAKTGRWTYNTSSSINLHNLPKMTDVDDVSEKVAIINELNDPDQSIPMLDLTLENMKSAKRALIQAHKGKTLIIADWSNIEIVIFSYLLQEQQILNAIQMPNFDIYRIFPVKRKFGKQILISYMYGIKLNSLIKKLSGQIDQQTVINCYNMCESLFTNRKRALYHLNLLLNDSIKELNINNCVILKKYEHCLEITFTTHKKKIYFTNDELKNYYPEKLLQNIIQAIAREKLCDALICSIPYLINKEISILFHVHDEIIFEVDADINKKNRSKEIIHDIMSKSFNLTVYDDSNPTIVPVFRYKMKENTFYI